MREATAPQISKWPFFLGDALLVGLAWLIYVKSESPLGLWQVCACVVCVSLGAWIAVLPYLTEYRAAAKFGEAEKLVSATDRIQNLEGVAAQISQATGQWQTVRESADKTAAGAREITDRMTAEVKAFNEFLCRANEDERAMLRLEADKLRRAEGEWLKVLVRILDHVYAVTQAAGRSRQPGVAEQLGRFQMACHDAARRIGLVPFIPSPSEPLDSERHQLADPNAKPGENAVVQEAIANGYTYQGKLIRPSLVRHRENGDAVSEGTAGSPVPEPSPQPQLPLEPDAPRPV
jgi:molecular chaperone GrpE (heat shock protein)